MAKNYEREDKLYDYDPNEDYQALIDQAVGAGDLSAAAKYEQQRNEKIVGEGLNQYQTTNQYAQYLPKPSYADQMEDILGQIMDRKPFEYDMNADALYEQYKDQYMKQGKLAMQDTMGQAAALTGGYGNSYAQTVGQQAYHQYLGGLNDIVPELYALARERYDAEGKNLLDKYSLLSAEEEKAYSLALSMLQSGIMPSDDVLGASGLSMEDAQAIYEAAKGYGGSGSRTTDNIARTADGEEVVVHGGYDGYIAPIGVVYGAGMEMRDFSNLMQRLSRSDAVTDEILALINQYSSQMTPDQWAQVERWLDAHGG